jgi:hypothetical protein
MKNHDLCHHQAVTPSNEKPRPLTDAKTILSRSEEEIRQIMKEYANDLREIIKTCSENTPGCSLPFLRIGQ